LAFTLLHPFIPGIPSDALRDLVRRIVSGHQRQDLILRQQPGIRWIGYLDLALEDHDAQLPLLQVHPEQRAALSDEGCIPGPDLEQLHVSLRAEGCIALLERQAVDLLAFRGEHQLIEFELRELAQPGGGSVLELDLGKTVFPRGQLEAFGYRQVHRGGGPILHVGTLHRDFPFHKTEAHHAHVRVGLRPGEASREKQSQTNQRK
jgi:hypothetical protein